LVINKHDFIVKIIVNSWRSATRQKSERKAENVPVPRRRHDRLRISVTNVKTAGRTGVHVSTMLPRLGCDVTR